MMPLSVMIRLLSVLACLLVLLPLVLKLLLHAIVLRIVRVGVLLLLPVLL